MEMHIDELLEKVTNLVKSEAKTETIIGEPFELGDFKCVPVIKLGLGFGSGGSQGSDSKQGNGQSGGAGAGVGLVPMGFLVTNGGDISFVSTEKSSGLSAVLEKVPEFIDKIIDKNKTTV